MHFLLFLISYTHTRKRECVFLLVKPLRTYTYLVFERGNPCSMSEASKKCCLFPITNAFVTVNIAYYVAGE